MGYGPISSLSTSTLPYASGYITASASIVGEEPITRIYAATEYFITRATDVPADTAFSGTLQATLRLDSSIGAGDGGYGGFSDNISELTLINADGEYDDFAGAISINGQSVRFSIGQSDDSGLVIRPYAIFELTALFVAERFRVSRQSVVIEMRDASLPLLTQAAQKNLYTGLGGLEGSVELVGKRKPYLNGTVFNVTPTLVIPNELLYQLNDGALAAISKVKDGGIQLTSAGDFANVATLRAAAGTIAPGFYGTSLSDGYFILGGTPFKQVTVDASGNNSTTADIISALVATVTGAPALDTASFADLNTEQSAIVGYYLDSNQTETCADVITKLMNGIGGWWGMTPMEKLRVKRFSAPDENELSASYTTQGGDMVEIDRTALPASVDPPPRRRRVIYQRNYTVQTDLFGEVIEFNPALADVLRNPHQLASTSTTEAATILQNFPDAPDPAPVESYFASQEDAQEEAERLFELYTQGFTAFRFTLKNNLFVHHIGDVINVTDNRLGLEDGRYLRLVALSDDCSRMQTEAVGFG